MHMNLEQLRGFITIAEVGHFTHAAELLHLTQPSLSRQISTLEQELGSELFHRARGNISLTAAGQALLPRARRMLADEETIRSEMADLAGLRRGRVRLGAPPTLCVSLVSEVLEIYRENYPGVQLQIFEAGSHRLLEQLAGGELDLALIVTSEHAVNEKNLQNLPLLEEQLVVIDSLERPHLAEATCLTLKDLAPIAQLAFSHSYDLRASTAQAYKGSGLVPNIVVEGGEMDAVLRFVHRGLGVAVVPATVALETPGIRAIALRDPQLVRTIGLAHRRDVSLTRAASAMHGLIEDTAKILSARHEQITSLF